MRWGSVWLLRELCCDGDSSRLCTKVDSVGIESWPAFGGGVEYRVKHHYNLRVDLEEQKWPDFSPHTLSPIAITAGVAYVIR